MRFRHLKAIKESFFLCCSYEFQLKECMQLYLRCHSADPFSDKKKDTVWCKKKNIEK